MSEIDLFQPELLSREQLRFLFKQRQFSLELYDKLDDNELLELYYSTLMPLSQKRYINSRRGKLLNLKRKASLQKENSSEKVSSTMQKKLATHDSSKTPSKSSHSPISFEKKIIKISSGSKNGISKRHENESTLNSTKHSKIIKLINDTISANGSHSRHSSNHHHHHSSHKRHASPEDMPKKKHKPITWP